jgi:carboxypeptidase family protein
MNLHIARGLFLACVLSVRSAFASPSDSLGTLVGRVVDEKGLGLQWVSVIVLDTGRDGSTDQTGAFRIQFVPQGRYTVRARQPGYVKNDIADVQIKAGDTTVVAFTLKERPYTVMLDSTGSGSSWCVLAPMEVWNEYDIGFASSLVPIDSTYDQRISSPHILREGPDGPAIVEIPGWRHWSQSMKPGVRVSPSPSMGLVEVDFDTMSTSTHGDVMTLRFTPVVLVVDTTGAEQGSFPGMTQACWSPDGRRLAMVKADTLPAGLSGPPPSRVTSVVVWDAASRALAAFATPVREVGWRDSIVMVDTGVATFTLDLRSNELEPARQRGVHVSPDGQYSWNGPAVSGLRVWRQEPKADLSRAVLGKIGGSSVQDRPRPFWVSGGNGHTLCVGVLDAQPGTQRFPSRKPIWRTVFLDVGRMTIIRSLSARLVGPTADRRRAVVRKGTNFEFVAPDGG